MLELLTSPEAWMSFLTLSLLEIVLGIDNLIFLAIVSSKLPKEKQRAARRIGLALALGLRVALLLSLTWIIGLTQPAFEIGAFAVSWRDIVLFGGGLFLLAKATSEIHGMVEGIEEDELTSATKQATNLFAAVCVQIAVIDLVFSLDSILTAIGMANHVEIMIAAVVVAIFVMLLASEPMSAFIDRHPTVKMLALSFLLLVGTALIADALHFHIPRGYLYFAIAFSVAVEALNMLYRKKQDGTEGVSDRLD